MLRSRGSWLFCGSSLGQIGGKGHEDRGIGLVDCQAKMLDNFKIYWRVDTFTKYLGGFLIAPKGIFIGGNKIIE
jgi:hypothetical protein